MGKTLRDFFKKGDMVLLSLCLAASAFGLVLIYSATRYLGSNRYVLIQAAGIAIGVVCYAVFTLVDIELFTVKTWKWMGLFNVAIILALIPFGVGEEQSGNKAWIPVPGLPINVQPAEVAKLFFVLLMAYQCVRLKERTSISHPVSMLTLVAHAGLMGGLITVISKDFGSALVYLLIFVVVAWCAGAKWWWFAGGLAGAAAALALLWNHIPGYIRGRVSVVFLRNDPLDAGWQQEHSVMAIGAGGITGQGYLKGVQTQRGAIPAQHTDEIFAVCGEEFGMVGCCLVMLLLAAIILRCFWVGRRAASPMSALIAMGYGGMFLFQTLINIGFCLYVFPVVGLTLPFFSYGGTSIITLFVAAGIVSGVKARSLPSWLQDRSSGQEGRYGGKIL